MAIFMLQLMVLWENTLISYMLLKILRMCVHSKKEFHYLAFIKSICIQNVK